ncbi:hypothetical protein RIF29_40483 [Crotalaria pallida]|uniref:GDT1 family protein n=1 Tax=Crotalaria pallida TaxID=3830 RepID=A0AAN9E8M9_CROPI
MPVNGDFKRLEQRPFFSRFFSPIFLKGDKSQLATICLAADENPFGVVLGGILISLEPKIPQFLWGGL